MFKEIYTVHAVTCFVWIVTTATQTEGKFYTIIATCYFCSSSWIVVRIIDSLSYVGIFHIFQVRELPQTDAGKLLICAFYYYGSFLNKTAASYVMLLYTMEWHGRWYSIVRIFQIIPWAWTLWASHAVWTPESLLLVFTCWIILNIHWYILALSINADTGIARVFEIHHYMWQGPIKPCYIFVYLYVAHAPGMPGTFYQPATTK